MGVAYKVDDQHDEVVTYRDALWRSMHGALERDDRVIIMGQGVDDFKGTFGSTVGLAEKFGAERVTDVPLAEEGMTGVAVGAALNGLYPIQTHIRVDFALLAMNQIINLAAKYKYMFGGRFEVPMMIRMIIGRSWGQGAQHSQSLQSLFAHIPGLTVLMPSSAESIERTYPWVIENVRGPVLTLEHRLLYDVGFHAQRDDTTDTDDDPLASRILHRGDDVTIVATSIMVLEALKAAEHFKEQGIGVEVIDLVSPSHPSKDKIVESVRRTGRLLVADTSWCAYGVAAEMCRLVCEADPTILKQPVVTMGMAPAPCPTAKTLEDLYYPNLRRLCDRVAALTTGREEHDIPLPEDASMADVYKRFKGPF